MGPRHNGLKTFGEKYKSGYETAEPFTRKRSAPATLMDNQLKQLLTHNPDKLEKEPFKPQKKLKQEPRADEEKVKKMSLQTMVKKKINTRITASNIVFDHFNMKAEPEKTRATTNRTNIQTQEKEHMPARRPLDAASEMERSDTYEPGQFMGSSSRSKSNSQKRNAYYSHLSF